MTQEKIYGYFEQNKDLHVLFVFDPLGDLESELMDKTWHEDYRYVDFDGCWFRTQYLLLNDWKNEKVVLHFKTGSPLSTETKDDFPLLGMLMANMEYKDDDYAAFMQRYRIPNAFVGYIQRHVSELQKEKVMKVLEIYYTKDFNIEIINRGLISIYLKAGQLLDWEEIMIRLLVLGLPSERNNRDDFFRSLWRNNDAKTTLNAKIKSIFNTELQDNQEEHVKLLVESLKYNVITQYLTTDTSDHYAAAYKVKNAYALQLMNVIMERGCNHPRLAAKFKEVIEQLGSNIKEEKIVSCYGTDANYSYLSESLGWIILKGLFKLIKVNGSAVIDRIQTMVLQTEPDSLQGKALRYAELLASFYEKQKSFGSLILNSPDIYTTRYMSDFYLFDSYYRKSISLFNQLAGQIMPVADDIHTAKEQLDTDYADLSFQFNYEWMRCLKNWKGGMSSVSLKRQSHFFEDRVKNVTNKLVVIVSDALRYEVAVDLFNGINKEGKFVAKMDACFAMLPTETKYCKPSLLPHQKLNFNGGNMTADENMPVDTILQREQLIRKYRDDACCVDYSTVLNSSLTTNRELFKRSLVYVFHDRIDEAGHSKDSSNVVNACKEAIEELTTLVKLIHSSYNVTNIIITSDHGFLYNCKTYEEKDKQPIKDEQVIEEKSRYYLTHSNQPIEGIIKLPLNEVSDMKDEGIYVALPISTNRLKASGGYNFAHGGASLQEMIVPVITSSLKKSIQKQMVNFTLLSKNLTIMSSRLNIILLQDEPVSEEYLERTIVCGIFEDHNLVCEEKTICLNSTDADLSHRQNMVELRLNKPTLGGMLKLRIYDSSDKERLNPIVEVNVKNSTLIEQDFG